jgi:hypothetical protein
VNSHAYNFGDILIDQLHDAKSQWSIGTFGAIAEFCHVADEALKVDLDGKRIRAVNKRGGISVRWDTRCRLFASESIAWQGWSQRLAVCMRAGDATMNGRSVLTEISEDKDALRPADRDGILFDLGLGAPRAARIRSLRPRLPVAPRGRGPRQQALV